MNMFVIKSFISVLLIGFACGTREVNSERSKVLEWPHNKHIRQFNEVAMKQPIITDKVNGHNYGIMYGMFLGSMQAALKRSGGHKMKLLEIGLGCHMGYGPGASVTLWHSFFGESIDLWEAEYEVACVEESRKKGQLKGISVVTGDQGNKTVLGEWVKQSGGGFHAIIDDGGHQNYQIKNSFDVLFEKALAPGGVYFIEDIQVGRHEGWGGKEESIAKQPAMTDIIQSWIEQLIIYHTNLATYLPRDKHVVEMRAKWPIPPEIEWIFCQAEACAFGKKGPPGTNGKRV